MPAKKINIPGTRYGRWTTLSEQSGCYWLCECDCGNRKTVHIRQLRDGKSKSCGCWYKETRRTCQGGHGLSTKNGKRSPTYRSWALMLDRCRNPNNKSFHNYGGRGIRVCERWMSFENFYADMGERPKAMSIDRIDVNGNYEPANCRWATEYEQSRNKRKNLFVEIGGERRLLLDWSKHYGISLSTVRMRIAHGMDPIAALTSPLRTRWGLRKAQCS